MPLNQVALLKQARVALWNSLHIFKVNNLTVENFKYFYLDNHTIENKKRLSDDFEILFDSNTNFQKFDVNQPGIYTLNSLLLNSKILNAEGILGRLVMVNTIADESEMKVKNRATLFNCHFKNCKIQIGENSVLNDILLVIKG